MNKSSVAQINTFPISGIKDNAQPSEQVFVLSSSQPQDFQEALDNLLERIRNLEAIVASQNEKIAALETTQLQDINRISLDIAHDRQRIAQLERGKAQPLQRDRGEILTALIAANGGKILAKDARHKMRMSEQLFSMLIASMKDTIEVQPLRSNKRYNILILR
jgi:hypothetical protein